MLLRRYLMPSTQLVKKYPVGSFTALCCACTNCSLWRMSRGKLGWITIPFFPQVLSFLVSLFFSLKLLQRAAGFAPPPGDGANRGCCAPISRPACYPPVLLPEWQVWDSVPGGFEHEAWPCTIVRWQGGICVEVHNGNIRNKESSRFWLVFPFTKVGFSVVFLCSFAIPSRKKQITFMVCCNVYYVF